MPQAGADQLFQKYFNKTASAAEEEELFRLLHYELDEVAVQALLENAYKDFEPSVSPFPEESRGKMLANIRQSLHLRPVKRGIVRRVWVRVAAVAALVAALAVGYQLWDRNTKPAGTPVQLLIPALCLAGNQPPSLWLMAEGSV